MIRLRNAAVGLALLALHACFVSTDPLLPEGEAVFIAEGAVAFCGDPGEDCYEAVVEGDTYVIYPPPEAEGEEPMRMRFRELTGSELGTVWLGEVELRDGGEEDTIWYYGVAHAMPPGGDDLTRFEMVQPDCMEATLRQAGQYGIEPLGSHTCSIGSMDLLAAYLVEAHGEDFNDPSWWSDRR